MSRRKSIKSGKLWMSEPDRPSYKLKSSGKHRGKVKDIWTGKISERKAIWESGK